MIDASRNSDGGQSVPRAAVTVADLIQILQDVGRCADTFSACPVGGSTSVCWCGSATVVGSGRTRPDRRRRILAERSRRPGRVGWPVGLGDRATQARLEAWGAPMDPFGPGVQWLTGVVARLG
jgi:hypothetical protein